MVELVLLFNLSLWQIQDGGPHRVVISWWFGFQGCGGVSMRGTPAKKCLMRPQPCTATPYTDS